MRSTIGFGLVLALAAFAADASAAKDPFNVDVTFGWQGCMRPMEWTPVEIGIKADLDEHFDGILSVSNLQDGQSTMTIQHKFVLTKGEPYYRPVVTKFAFGAPQCRVAIADARGNVRWSKEYSLWDFSSNTRSLTVVGASDLLVGVASGASSGISGRSAFGLNQLPKGAHSLGTTANRRYSGTPAEANGQDPRVPGQIFVKEKLLRYLPWDWTAYASLDVLVLYDPDWSALRAEQSKAIADWVSDGGKLLVVLGSHPLTAQHPLARLIPYRIGTSTPVEFARPQLTSWGCSEDSARAAACWPLEGGGDARWNAKACGTGRNVAAFGPYGFGRVGVIAFDPAALGGRQQENLAPFWVEAVSPLLDRRQIKAGAPPESNQNNFWNYEMDESGRGTAAIMEFLHNLPQMEPISIGWVILLLGGLALVIGPVDYFVLKKYDRLPLTWLTFAAYIGLFTVGAYYGVAALRGGPAQVRAVTVLDAVKGERTAWSCTYSGIFAPASDAYRLDGLGKAEWWSAVSPSAGDYLNVNEPRHGFSRRFICVQEDGRNLPEDVPINIWSMQCMMTEGPVDLVPLDATITVKGETIEGRIENRLDVPVASGSVRLDKNRSYAFGAIPANGAITIGHRLSVTPGWEKGLPEDSGYGDFVPNSGRPVTESAYFACGNLQRTRGIESLLRQGGAVVCVEYANAPLSYKLANHRQQTLHRLLVRLVVKPEKE